MPAAGAEPCVRSGSVPHGMTDARVLLERHRPRLVYDSHEAYFADSAAIWTDSPTNVLKRADGTVLAKPPKLALAFLGPHAYERRAAGARRPTRSARARATTPRTPRRCTARRSTATASTATPGATARPAVAPVLALLLLQRLPAARPALSGGKHEGDWELVQLRLDASRAARAGASPASTRPPRAAPWTDVRKSPRLARRLRLTPRTRLRLPPGAGLALDRRMVRDQARRARAGDHITLEHSRVPCADPGRTPLVHAPSRDIVREVIGHGERCSARRRFAAPERAAGRGHRSAVRTDAALQIARRRLLVHAAESRRRGAPER